MRCRKPSTAPLHRSSLPFFSLSTDCNKKYSCEESLVALLSVYPLSAPLLPLVESASAATSAATEGRKLLPLQPFSPWSHRRAPQSQSLSGSIMAASGCVYVTMCWSVCVCMAVCNECVCMFMWASVTQPDAFSYVAACWTQWAVLSHTECLCHVWARQPACTGWTTFLLHSHRKT